VRFLIESCDGYQKRGGLKNEIKDIERRKFIKTMLFGGTGLVVASYPFFIERYLVWINHYNIPVANLPSPFEGFTIVHLSDLHFGFLVPRAVIQWVVNKANTLQKDIIVCTGDYVHENNATEQIDQVWPILSQLSAPQGVYTVLGNHDHWADTERSLYWMRKSGQDLRHKAIPIERNGQCIWLGGTGDLWEDNLLIDPTFEGIPARGCKILLAHNPDTADTDFNTRIDLFISGHTHGGQVRIPFYGAPILPVNNKRYTSGYIRTDKTALFISRGIGWAYLPVRFNCPPEIAVLHLSTEK